MKKQPRNYSPSLRNAQNLTFDDAMNPPKTGRRADIEERKIQH
jgi:hypothetical protein